MTSDTETVGDIWADDKFDRQAEAELLADYIRSVSRRDFGREDKRGYTIAVDAPYGFGKSFFLERFAKHMKQTHPVAYINAWADDVADDPLAALVATIQEALGPVLQNNDKLQQSFLELVSKTGQVGKAMAKGALWKASTKFLGEEASESLVDLFEDGSQYLKDFGFNLQDETNNQAVVAAPSVPETTPTDETETTAPKLDQLEEATKAGTSEAMKVAENELAKIQATAFANRIATYKAATNAIKDVKAELASILEELPEEKDIPLVIVIDELDRCRPSYAIKLLEQINHLFDVPGMVFVLGLNGTQFGHAIAGAYGPGFEGQAYLRRFINRDFHLTKPDLAPLLRQLLADMRIDLTRLTHQSDIYFLEDSTGNRDFDTAAILAKLMNAFRLDARSAFEVVDKLQTSMALLQGSSIFAGYLLPLIVEDVAGSSGLNPPIGVDLVYYEILDVNKNAGVNYILHARNLHRVVGSSLLELRRQHVGDAAAGHMAVFKQDHATAANHFSDPKNYHELIKTVARFSLPEPEPQP